MEIFLYYQLHNGGTMNSTSRTQFSLYLIRFGENIVEVTLLSEKCAENQPDISPILEIPLREDPDALVVRMMEFMSRHGIFPCVKTRTEGGPGYYRAWHTDRNAQKIQDWLRDQGVFSER